MKKKTFIIAAIVLIFSAIFFVIQSKECYAAQDAEITIKSIDSDIKREVLEDAYNTNNIYDFDTKITIHKADTDSNSDVSTYLPYGKSIDFVNYIKETLNKQDFFEEGKEYTLTLGPSNNVVKEKVEGKNNGENITFSSIAEVPNEYQCAFIYHENDKINIEVTGKVLGSKFNFSYEGVVEEGEDDYLKPEFVNLKLELSSTRNNPNDYYKLIKEDNGNLTYEYVKTAHGANSKDYPVPTEGSGLVDFLRVNKGKTTTIVAPYGTGATWRFYSAKSFEPGDFDGEFGTSTGGLNIHETYNRVYTIKCKSKYDVKTITKTDVKGNPVDASYEVYFNNTNKRKEEKFVFKHYDTKIIKGKEYKNVYEAISSTNVDDNSSESVISTKDGELTLFYPMYYISLPYYSDYEEPYNLKISPSGGSKKLNEMRVVEKSTDYAYVVSQNSKIIKPYEDETDSYTFINKKKPTVTEILDSDSKYDGEFVYEIYDVETGKLVGTEKAGTGETVTLEPKVTDENGNTTGYLEDGKKYKVVKKEVEIL